VTARDADLHRSAREALAADVAHVERRHRRTAPPWRWTRLGQGRNACEGGDDLAEVAHAVDLDPFDDHRLGGRGGR